MKASNYNIFLDKPETGETILYNSLYGSLTILDQDEVSTIKHILSNPLQTEVTDTDIKKILVEQKYLIDDAIDEIKIIGNRKISGVNDSNRLDVIIMPTMDCNFACRYCYESLHPSMMTEETEKAIKIWLENQISKYKVLFLSWFGGEPLLGYPRVVSISQHAANIGSTAGVSCVTHITTNGYLLNKQYIKELIQAGIYNYQITLDGPPDTHDKLRVLKNGSGTFRRIFENIVILSRADERVKISLRINFNHSNLHSIPQLLEMFPVEIRPHLRVVYEPIFGNCTLSATDNLVPKEISEAMADYYKMAEQLGYDVVIGASGIHTGKLVYCYAERGNQLIINYNGDVYKCSVSKFKPEDRVGYIRADGVLVKEDEQWNQYVNTKLFEQKCYSCLFLPLCMGGCRKMRIEHQETGSYCALVPTNASYLLKQIALGGFEKEVMSR